MFIEQQSEVDPVTAYDRMARYFDAIRTRRQKYCDAIDELVLANWPVGARSMLDVGCGEGMRAETLAQRAAIEELVLLEPSEGMRKQISGQRDVWSARVEELPNQSCRFDVITCLWNVLGHVPSPDKRLQALRNMRDLLSPGGALFLDVQNRYNARQYGTIKTAARMLYDVVTPSIRNGDVTVRWNIEGGLVKTYGHVFRHSEMLEMFRQTGLTVRKSAVVNYATGQQQTSRFAGSMFFVLGY